jgi:GNAT superfamily N-acetyltransferase
MPHLSAPTLLTVEHDTSSFDCGQPVLDDWLQKRALKNQAGFSRTYVVYTDRSKGSRVVGYYALAAGAVTRTDAPPRTRRNAPDAIPVAVLGRLAVDRSVAGQGLGADLLADALSRIAAAADTIGIRAVLVQAKDDAAKRFYERCAEFAEFPVGSRTLFLPTETLQGALAQKSPGAT